MLGVTAVWGSTFVVVKDAIGRMPVSDFLTWRFAVATVALLLLRPRTLARLGPRGWRHGFVLGLALAGGYLLQTYGLRTTPAGVSGFITGMFVVFTPLVAGVLLRRSVPRPAWAAVALATAGLGLLSLHGAGLSLGATLTLGCALAYALHIVGLGEWSAGQDPYALAVVQLGTVTAVSACAAVPTHLAPPPDWGVVGALGLTSVLATALAFVVQTWAQARLDPTRAAVIMTMEPVWAGAFGVAYGESLGWRGWTGAVLVLAAMLLVDVGPRIRRRQGELPRLEV